MKRFLRRAAVGLAWTMAALVVLLILFYAEEDWRGARDWAACQQELQAKGEILDLRQLVPPGKPEDDLSKAPIFAEMYQKKPPAEGRVRQMDVYLGSGEASDLPKFSSFLKDKPLDLASWQKFYRSLPKAGLSGTSSTPAQDVLTVLTRFDPDMNDIDAAIRNPKSFWPVDYAQPVETPLAAATAMIKVAKILQLRATAHLENNQADLAEKDYLLSFHPEQPLAHRCFLVDYLVGVAVRAIDDSILWEGLHRHAWNDAQLHEMDSALGSNSMLGLAAKSLRTERASALQTIKFVHHRPYNFLSDWAAEPDFTSKCAEIAGMAFLKLRPSGWAVREYIFHSQEMQKQIEAINVSLGVLNPLIYKTWKDPKTFGILTKINFVSSLTLLGPYERTGCTIARAETYRRLARLACRLEEYRIAQGRYPEKLEELPGLPAHLNQEVLSEQPLRYQRKGEGYLLYSIGWDEKDGGGVMDGDPQKGDWVWPSP